MLIINASLDLPCNCNYEINDNNVIIFVLFFTCFSYLVETSANIQIAMQNFHFKVCKIATTFSKELHFFDVWTNIPLDELIMFN